jgi:hypothetical protein
MCNDASVHLAIPYFLTIPNDIPWSSKPSADKEEETHCLTVFCTTAVCFDRES